MTKFIEIKEIHAQTRTILDIESILEARYFEDKDDIIPSIDEQETAGFLIPKGVVQLDITIKTQPTESGNATSCYLVLKEEANRILNTLLEYKDGSN